MEDEIGESTDNPPIATTPSSKWTATSTYDIYMVGTPNHSKGGEDDGNGNGNLEDHAGEPQSDLGPEDEDILNESFSRLAHDALRIRLVSMAKKTTSEEAQFIEDR